jgi:ACT domain-containing protein
VQDIRGCGFHQNRRNRSRFLLDKPRLLDLGEEVQANLIQVLSDLYRQKQHTIDEICKAVGISRPTLYKYVAAAGDI